MMDPVAYALGRTTLCTIVAAGIAILLLRSFRIHSPIVHRIVWVAVLLQGWTFVPVIIELPIGGEPVPTDTAGDVVVLERVSPASNSTLEDARHRFEPNPSTSIAACLRWIAVLWVIGAIVAAFGYLRRYMLLLHRIPLGQIPRDLLWLAEWDGVARGSSVAARTQFRLTDNTGPMCCFVPFFYLILAPERLWSALDGRQRVAILQHELAHLQRRDLWKSVAVRILALPQWFNPLAWKAVRAFDEAAEWACDEIVMRARGNTLQTSYPRALLRLAEFSVEPLPGSVAARGGILATRIRRLVQPRFKEDSKMKKMLVPLLLLGLIVAQSIRIESVAAEKDQPVPDVQAVPVPVAADDQHHDGHNASAVADESAAPTADLARLAKIENQPFVYIIMGGGKDRVVLRQSCTPDSDVRSLLSTTTWPHPVNLAKSTIRVLRVKDNAVEVFPIDWTETTQSDGGMKLLPGDRIHLSGNVPAPEIHDFEAVRETDVPVVKLEMRVLRDLQGNLEEFESLKNGSAMLGETRQTSATLRILHRNHLIETLARPTMMCQSGVAARCEIQGSFSAEQKHQNDISIRVTPTVGQDDSMMLDTEMSLTCDGARHRVNCVTLIGKGTTVILRATPVESEQAKSNSFYVVITPELVR